MLHVLKQIIEFVWNILSALIHGEKSGLPYVGNATVAQRAVMLTPASLGDVFLILI